MQIHNEEEILDITIKSNEDFIDNKWGKQLADYKNYVKEYIKHAEFKLLMQLFG